MSRIYDTGESTAAIVARGQQQAWDEVVPRLRAGAILKRDAKLRRSYVDGWGGLTDPSVRRRVAAGDLVTCGMDQWKLADGR